MRAHVERETTQVRRDHRGTRNPNAVLTPALVAEARRLHDAKFGYGFIARWFGVSKSCIQALLTGRTWRSKTRPGRTTKRRAISR